MAEERRMTHEERIEYVSGQVEGLQIVVAGAINKLAPDQATRQTLSLFFAALSVDSATQASSIYRRGVANSLNQVGELIVAEE